jgi:ribA/ribD-fused uncharacterized protein
MPTFCSIPEDNRVLFFKRDRAQFGFLSNFHAARVEIERHVWPTVEHFYQAQKSTDRAFHALILEHESPGRAKRLRSSPSPTGSARKGSYFRTNPAAFRADWWDVRLEVMQRGVRAKFEQNPELAAMLLATDFAELVEDSERDTFWGAGSNGNGQNHLGRLLMAVRQELWARVG